MLVVLLGGPAAVGSAEAIVQDRPALAEAEVRGLSARYDRTDRWALQALILTSLGREWHPCGKAMLVDALGQDDLRLKAFAVEALRRTNPGQLRALADTELMDLLIRKEAKSKHGLYTRRVLDLLKMMAPRSEARTDAEWNRWWSRRRAEWKVGDWTFEEPPRTTEPRTQSIVQRAFDLRRNGLDLVFCLDSTGSMQPTIDAVRDALDGVVLLLQSIAPEFRVGLVHYRDLGDLSEGAKVLVALTPQVTRLRGRLEKMRAEGGGDTPERVEKGLELALDRRKMGWKLQTEKLVIVIGDAPPHHSTIELCVKLARSARENPFADGGDRTGAGEPRPFVISTIGVGTHHVARSTCRSFESIARAGGGAYVELLTIGTESTPDPSHEVLHHILELTFGPRWSDQLETFLRTFREYRDEEVF